MNKAHPREAELHDYDRDRYGYDHPASATRRHGHHRYADETRDSWQGASPTYDPVEQRDEGDTIEEDFDIEFELIEEDVPSSELLRDAVLSCLASMGREAHTIEAHVARGEVLLIGTVSTREAKYEAERLMDEVRGVQGVLNQLRVRYGDS